MGTYSSTMEELENCPFCKKPPIMIRIHTTYFTAYQVECERCGIQQTDLFASEKEAIEKWNRRDEK